MGRLPPPSSFFFFSLIRSLRNYNKTVLPSLLSLASLSLQWLDVFLPLCSLSLDSIRYRVPFFLVIAPQRCAESCCQRTHRFRDKRLIPPA